MSKNSLIGFIALALLLSSCEAIGSIFSAGVYTGVFLVVLVIIVIVVVIAKMTKRG